MKDIAIEEIRQIRHEISAEFDHDVSKYIAHLMKEQEKYKEQIERYRELERQNSQAMVLNDKPNKPDKS